MLSLRQRQPLGNLAQLTHDFDGFLQLAVKRPLSSFAPAIDIEETKVSFILKADLPGLSEKEIDIQLEGEHLFISGKREAPAIAGDGVVKAQERRFGSFFRGFTLGPNTSGDGITAAYKAGVLTVTIPKREGTQIKKIPVSLQ